MSTFLKEMKSGPRIILVTGHYGSGKTEFAVSLAFALAKEGGEKLALADLDIENPYFRSRERGEELKAAGVAVYSDPFDGKNGSELQTISPKALAPIQDPDTRVILDTGGDASGAMVLNQFRRHFHEEYRLLCVVNCNRPGTDTPEKAAEHVWAIERATGLKVSGLISNAHLIHYTTGETVREGYAFTKKVEELTKIPVLCVCAKSDIDARIPGVETFPIGMHMRDSYLDRKV